MQTKENSMDYAKLVTYLEENDLHQQFAELNAQQVSELLSLGVPEFEETLPRGEGYVYAGSSVFQWVNDPMIINY